MGKFDQTIKWLEAQIESATAALKDINSGFKIEMNGEDITDWWKSKYEQIVERSNQLIAAYRKQSD